MKNKQLIYSLLAAGMSLGTTWAIRGQFGHEQGAAWAGGAGALIIVLLAKRQDWYSKIFQLTLASAAGWGVGGIISYGIVVGYGRGSDFGNVYYGLLMLFVIGGLFGLLGGGLFGLMLADNKEKPVKTHQLLVEMTASAIIFYYLLIEEFGWLMTPPRSEAWAACFGMAVAMLWYMIRQKQYAALRVAVFAGFGAGFGFAFGNFLQVMGNVSGIHFNFWNVMEYAIGFFGGIGMAYGTFTSQWAAPDTHPGKQKAILPLILVTLVIPFIVWDQSFETERVAGIIRNIDPLADITAITTNIQWIALLSILVTASYWLYYFYFKQKENTFEPAHADIHHYFLSYTGLYAFLSILITGAFISLYRIEQYLYVVNIIIISIWVGRLHPSFSDRGLRVGTWMTNFLFVMAILVLLTAVAFGSHGDLKGAQTRF
jgi:hypothetical protein